MIKKRLEKIMPPQATQDHEYGPRRARGPKTRENGDMSLSAKHTTRLIVAMSALAASMTLMAPTPASATEACIGTTTNGHGIDSDSGDCVYMNVYTAVDGRIVVKYSGNQDYDFYQLRWSRPGRTESQLKVRGSGSHGSWWALGNAWENTPYTFKVQACYSSLFGSDCTSWKAETYRK